MSEQKEKKAMKKAITVLCVILLLCALALVGCGKNKDDTLGSTSSKAETGNRMENAVTEGGNVIGDAATGIGDTVGDVVTGAGDLAGDVVTGAGDIANDIVTGAGDMVSNATR